jgi:3-deoxy-D-manno-octulosonic-acid transferase
MGEINAIGSLLKQLEKTLPQYEFVISSTTDTGIDRAHKLYGNTHSVLFFPLDFSWAVKRAFARLKPSACILMELEVWHNFTTIAAKRGIPVIVANGRISSGKGFKRYRKIAPLVRPMFRSLSLVLAQDKTYAGRFEFLGVPGDRLQIAGSLKYDTAEVSDTIAGADQLARQLRLNQDNPILVAGSTGPGEEKIILASFRQLQQRNELANSRLIIVPRKPERFDEVAHLIESSDYRILRYSKIKTDAQTVGQDDSSAVILGDTMGDLRKFYSLATVIFVGRSLVPMGGSDMIEAAALAKPVIVGPFTDNFTDSVEKLLANQAIEIVADSQQLTTVAAKLLSDPQAAQAMGRQAQKVIIDNQGATFRSAAAIAKLLTHSSLYSRS